jgi:signal transduction histidine kinase
MAGIGQLAAGVAHEINNPTGFILGNQDVLKKHVEITANILEQLKQLYQDASSLTIANGELLNNKIKALLSDTNFDYIKQDMYAIITETIEGALRIKNIVSALSGFIHPDRQIKKPEDISLIIDQALILVANEAKYKCDIEKHYETVEKIVCNRDQLIQVFVNLLINAIQSISGRGKIIIDLFCDDKFVCIRFTDTGIGIAAKNISRIFEPFFTTKDVGQGTGLGLAIVYNIIKAHNGLVDVVSQESRGSVFTVKLPK